MTNAVIEHIPSRSALKCYDPAARNITMSNAVIECILSRSAVKYYDPAATLSDDQIQRAGANRHHRANILPLAELARHCRPHA